MRTRKSETSVSEAVRIVERDEERRHRVGKYDGVKVAVVMPDGTMTTAPLSDYGFEQLFIEIISEADTPAAHVREMVEAYEDAPIDAATRRRASAYFRKHGKRRGSSRIASTARP